MPANKLSGDMTTNISIGEFLDKITILEIKSERIHEPDKLTNIQNELTILNGIWNQSGYDVSKIKTELDELKQINESLWEIEDKIRRKETEKSFDEEFIQLARSVYVTNDQRAATKKLINTKLGSSLIEEKSYQPY